MELNIIQYLQNTYRVSIMKQGQQLRTIYWNECLSHISKQSCWLVIHQLVYDVTKFIPEHPGGQQILLECAGDDASRKFDQIDHSEYAKSIMSSKAIGKIQGQITQAYSRTLREKKQKVKNYGSNCHKEQSQDSELSNTSKKKPIVIASNLANQHLGKAQIVKNIPEKHTVQQFRYTRDLKSSNENYNLKSSNENYNQKYQNQQQNQYRKQQQKWWKKRYFKILAATLVGIGVSFAGWYFLKNSKQMQKAFIDQQVKKKVQKQLKQTIKKSVKY